jgi:Anti-sigma-K factor rskA
MRGGPKHPSRDDLAAYALGAVEGREERDIAKHIEGCERCEAEMRERLAPAVAVLAESVEQVEPPPELRQSLLATVREEAAVEAGAEAPARRPARRAGLKGFLLRPATGLAVVALAAAGVAGYLVADGGQDGQDTTVELSNTASGAAGTLVLEDDSATLHMTGMDPLEMGDVYQVWVGDPSGVQPSASFVPHADGTATAAVPEAASGADQVMITVEPMAGRRTPSGEIVFDAPLT